MNRRRTLIAAVGLFLCSVTILAVVSRIDSAIEVLRLEYLALCLVLTSAFVTFRDGNLWRAWALVFALSAGFGVHLGGIGIAGDVPGLFFRVIWAGLVGLVAATTLGILGGVVGLGLQRLSLKQKGGEPGG